MSLLFQDRGEQIQPNLQNGPQGFSGLDLFQAERWLVENGLISETTADTLVMYGYMAPGAEKVRLKVDLDIENDGKDPSAEYTVSLRRSRYLAERLTTHLASRRGLLPKLLLFVLLRSGAPAPRATETLITSLAKSFLPENFEVRVNVQPN